QWRYEPKWDGFRCLAFRDGKRVDLQSKSQKPLTRYFPELVAALAGLRAKKFVVDGEIVIAVDGQLSFDDLLMRIHPAPSRVQRLSETTPATFILFDLPVDEDGANLSLLPLYERRKHLETFAKTFLKKTKSIRLSPMTDDLKTARHWF